MALSWQLNRKLVYFENPSFRYVWCSFVVHNSAMTVILNLRLSTNSSCCKNQLNLHQNTSIFVSFHPVSWQSGSDRHDYLLLCFRMPSGWWSLRPASIWRSCRNPWRWLEVRNGVGPVSAQIIRIFFAATQRTMERGGPLSLLGGRRSLIGRQVLGLSRVRGEQTVQVDSSATL